ncbi:MAG: MFS transporter [Planctomycetota bacterium]
MPPALDEQRQPAKHDPFAAIRERNYRYFAFTFVTSSMGLQMMATALGWEVWTREKSFMALGLVGLARALPVLVLTLPAGTLVDRSDRKKVLSITQIAFGAVAFALAVASANAGSVWLLLGLVVVSGCIRSFNAPSRGALLPSLLPPERFENAIAWQSGFFQFAAVVGPLLAGLMMYLTGEIWPVYATTGVLCICAGVAAIFLNPRPVVRSSPTPGLGGVLDGARHIWHEKTILGALTLDLLAVLFGGATALLPAYADRLGVGEIGLGALRAAPYVGAFGMAIWLAARPTFRNAGFALLSSVAGFGVCMIVFGLSEWFWLSLVALAVSGALDNISVVIRHVLVQMRTPDEMRGRTTAVNTVFIESSNEIGAFESGLVAKHFGPVFSVVSGGIGTLCVVAFVALAFPQLRRMKQLTESKEDVRHAEEAEEEHRRAGADA